MTSQGRMEANPLVILLSFVMILWPLVQTGNHREDLIQDSVRRLLGVKPGVAIPPAAHRNTTLPPRYVMDLYEKYRSGHTPMQGNTVRSILPMRDTIGEADVLIFNLTGINPSEQILQSKLYLLKRRKPKAVKKRDHSHFRIKIGSLPQMTSHRFIEVSLSRQKSEWYSYDITDSVVHCRQSKKEGDYLLGLTLEIRRSRGSYRLSPFRRLLKQNSQPFVLIFSEDSSNQSRNAIKTRRKQGDIQDLLRSKADQDEFVADDYFNDQDSEEILRNRKKRSHSPIQASENNLQFVSGTKLNKTHNNSTYETLNRITAKIKHLHNILSEIHQYTTLNYSKRSFISNTQFEFMASEAITGLSNEQNALRAESPTSEVIGKLPKVLSILSTSKILTMVDRNDMNIPKVRKRRSISTKLGLSTIPKDLKEPHATPNTFQTINDKYMHKLNSGAVASSHGRRRGRKKHKRKKKKKKGNHKLPHWWTRHESNLHSEDHKNMCQRKSLVVDFEKLGWSEWVMSPKSFNAHYCTGRCSFPIIKDAHPSNHAAIQSLVYAMGLNPSVPTPCCVPSVTRPLTLLYFDENGNLILKNYPNMIVEKCACR